MQSVIENIKLLLITHKFFFFFVEIFGSTIIYTIHLEKRKKFVIRINLCILTFLGIVWANGILDKIKLTPKYWIGFIAIIIVNLFWFFMVWGIYKITLQEAAFTVTCAYLTEHIQYSIRILLQEVTKSDFLSPGKVQYLIFNGLFYFLIYWFFSRKLVESNHYDVKILNSLQLILMTVLVVLVMSLFASIYHFERIHAIYALISCALLLGSERKHIKQLKLQEELKLNKLLWAKHESQYELSKQTIDIINRKCHDLKKQIYKMGEMSLEKDRMQAMESIVNDVNIYSAMIESGNEILDTILTEKGLICSENKIQLECMIDGRQLEFMKTVDLYTLFESMLENAIEGNLKIDAQKRIITIQIFQRANLVFIQVENPFDGIVKMQNETYLTTKKEKEGRGYGLKYIKEIVEKYHGVSEFQVINQIFVAKMVFPKE